MRTNPWAMTEQTQLEYLRAAKDELGLKWDDLAKQAGIKPRALKTYRMPPDSQDHRGLSDLARNAIEKLLDKHRKRWETIS